LWPILAEGFDAIEAYLAGIGRSPTAFCACELRSAPRRNSRTPVFIALNGTASPWGTAASPEGRW